MFVGEKWAGGWGGGGGADVPLGPETPSPIGKLQLTLWQIIIFSGQYSLFARQTVFPTQPVQEESRKPGRIAGPLLFPQTDLEPQASP